MAEQVLKKEKLLLNADKWQVRPSSWILAVYIALMPVSTALADLFAGPSVMTLFAGIYIMVSLCEVVFIYRRLEADIRLLPVYAYFLFTMASCLWNEYFDADWYFGQFAITTAIVFCITVKRVSVKEIKLFKLAMYISILIAVISTLMNLPKPGKRLMIWITSYMDPNDFACGLAIVVSLFLVELMNKKTHYLKRALRCSSGHNRTDVRFKRRASYHGMHRHGMALQPQRPHQNEDPPRAHRICCNSPVLRREWHRSQDPLQIQHYKTHIRRRRRKNAHLESRHREVPNFRSSACHLRLRSRKLHHFRTLCCDRP